MATDQPKCNVIRWACLIALFAAGASVAWIASLVTALANIPGQGKSEGPVELVIEYGLWLLVAGLVGRGVYLLRSSRR